MKILKLSIENVRGIRKELMLNPNGQNVVIHGPNGTGKSAVVDAIDFLFTGDISRLKGRGSRGMSIKDHGAHIDTQPKDAVVKAIIKIDGIDEPISLKRVMSKPKELLTSETDREKLNETIEIAKKGQHVLSRAEILKYIAAESGTRAEEIQAILNLTIIDDIRKAFVTLERDSSRIVQDRKVAYEKSKSIIQTKLGITDFNDALLLKEINDRRKILKGDPLGKIEPNKIQEGVSPAPIEDKNRVDPENLRRLLSKVDELISKKGQEIFRLEEELRLAVKKLNDDVQLKRNLDKKRLLEIGISLIDESGSCPLCQTPWEPGKLRPLLSDRLGKAKEAETAEKSIRTKATSIDTEVTKILAHVNEVAGITRRLKQDDISKEIEGWAVRLDEWSKVLKNAVEQYPSDKPSDSVQNFYKTDKWEQYKVKLKEIADGLAKFTPEQEAWDALTALSPMLTRYFEEKELFENASDLATKASIMSRIYTETKDRVLEDLYKSVNNDFIDYYKYIHGEDERGFYSELKSEGAQLDFKVDFYGRGTHHPRALHSEGHQDSMGLCLYLALNKKISEEKVNLVILDDVVMSIDSGHRRNVCRLLKNRFPENQFIITTHNKTWARQLKTDRVVNSDNVVEFKSWSVDTGPRFEEGVGIWDSIQKNLADNKIGLAAQQLREHGEFFYENVCSSLIAEVRYKGDGRWDLGDYMNGAKKAYKECLKSAKRAASSWGNNEEIAKLTEIETQANEIIQRTQMEQWGVNENIHFSKWADFTKEDFLPIVEAFQDFEGLFTCPNCKALIAVNTKGTIATNVKCWCGKINWNLEEKKNKP